MKTHEQLRDELAFVIANSSADAYVTKTDEQGIRRTEFDVGIVAQAVINHLTPMMDEVREALVRVGDQDRTILEEEALAKLECWRG
jgi:spore germination protein YaaH